MGPSSWLVDTTDEDLMKCHMSNRPIYDSPEAFQAGERHYHRGMRTLSEEAPHNRLLTMFANAAGVRQSDGGKVENFGSGPGVLPGEFGALLA